MPPPPFSQAGCRRRHSFRATGFTLIELLVVIAIIAILVALLLPAVQQVREAARKSQCQDHLHNLAIAVHSYESTHKLLPPGYISRHNAGTFTSATWCTTGGTNNLLMAPWTVLLLPFIEQKPLYDQFDTDVVFTSTGNVMVAPNVGVVVPVAIYQCPSDKSVNKLEKKLCYYGVQGGGLGSVNGMAAGSCASNVAVKPRRFFSNGLFYHNSKVGMQDIGDGTSNVFMFGENRYNTTNANWFWALSGKVDGSAIQGALSGAFDQINLFPSGSGDTVDQMAGFSSDHPGGAQFALGDGKVAFVSENIDLFVYHGTATRDDGLPLGGFR